MEIFDITSAFVQLTMAIVLVSISTPDDKQWSAIRRMNRLLFACYACIGLSNIATGLLGVGIQGNDTMWLAILLVSMYQAMLFTATCVTFISPHRADKRWLSINTGVITLVSIGSIVMFYMDKRSADWLIMADALFYSAQLVYYSRLYRMAFIEIRQQLEACYDEDLSASLRWITKCFVSALMVGISALVFSVCRLGTVEYVVFTCAYTIYYVYLVVCVINYRISAGFIIKAVTASLASTDNSPLNPKAISNTDERQIEAALKQWVDQKMYTQNDQTVEEIAYGLGITHAMMKWYFTNRLHTTFRTWRITLRIAEAKRLLSDDGVSASGVHKLVGIADKSNFHKLFCKQVGMTPREYKESVSCERQTTQSTQKI